MFGRMDSEELPWGTGEYLNHDVVEVEQIEFLCRVELGGGQHYFSKIIWFDYFVHIILELSKL